MPSFVQTIIFKGCWREGESFTFKPSEVKMHLSYDTLADRHKMMSLVDWILSGHCQGTQVFVMLAQKL